MQLKLVFEPEIQAKEPGTTNRDWNDVAWTHPTLLSVENKHKRKTYIAHHQLHPNKLSNHTEPMSGVEFVHLDHLDSLRLKNGRHT